MLHVSYIVCISMKQVHVFQDVRRVEREGYNELHASQIDAHQTPTLQSK